MSELNEATIKGLKEEIKALRIALQEKDDSFKAYIAEEVKRQVDAHFESYSRLLGIQVPIPANRFYK